MNFIKKVLVIQLLMAFVAAFSQEGIRFADLKLQELVAEAKKENKILFIDAYASWCGPCKLMEKNVFTDAQVSSFYNANFVNARIDMEKGEGREIAQKFQVGSYPTYLFLNGDGALVFRGMGYLPSDDFIALAKEANSPFNKKGSLKEQFEKGESDPVFLKNAVKMYANTDRAFAKKVTERYFATKKDKTFSQEETSMLLYFLESAKDPNYRVFVSSKDEITKVLPINIYNQFNSQLQLGEVSEKAIDQNSKTVNDAYFLQEAKKLVPEADAVEALGRLKLKYYASTENFEAYEKTAVDYYGDGESADPQELAMVAFIFSEKATKPEYLKKALVWAEKSVMANETFETDYILAKLYLKNGNSSSAKMYAQQALALAKKSGADTSAIESLISQIK